MREDSSTARGPAKWPRADLPGLVVEKGDRPIRDMTDWLDRAGPLGKDRQWKDGRSAKELARAWFGSEDSTTPAIPAVLRDLLTSHPRFSDLDTFRAIPEHKVPLDDFEGNTRNTDMLIIADAPSHRTVISIEAKADEPFERTIAERVAAAEKTLLKSPGSKALPRIRQLSRAILGREPNEAGGLRYQLLHAAAAALIEAKAAGADEAIMLIHEFRSDGCRPRNLERNASDLAAFVAVLAPDTSRDGALAGPMSVPGGGRVPVDVPLYIGKIVTMLETTRR